MYNFFLKRFIDVILSSVALIVFSPLLIVVTISILATGQLRPFFVQPRPGKNEKIFKVIKFKTMSDKRDKRGNLLPDIIRLTPIGKFIRSASLDELPQLFNVLNGDMSLIGPRPLRVHYLPLYSKEQARRHEVRPGITGWAQINGRNAISWHQKFEYDVWYVNNMNFCTDLKILFLTLLKVFKRDGVNFSTEISAKPFDGTN